MSFTDKKYSKLSYKNRIKKSAFAIKAYIEKIKPQSYAIDMLTKLNSFNCFSYSIPKSVKEWGILFHTLLNLIDDNSLINDREIFDKHVSKRISLPYIVLLDNIRTPHNTGSIIRTSEALGASKVLLTGITPDAAKNSKVKRTAMNSKIDVSYEKNAYDKILELKEEGYKIISIEKTPGATDIAHYKEKIPCVVIFGNEEFGVSDDVLSLSDEILFIPLYGNKNSLNVSVSSGIALYHISKNFTA